MNAEDVKKRAKGLGADFVGIASVKTLNAFPPDARYLQHLSEIPDEIVYVPIEDTAWDQHENPGFTG